MNPERPTPVPREEFELSRECLPQDRTLEDFPIGAEVVVYAMVWGQRELRRGTVSEHSRYGFVVVAPETNGRGIPGGRSIGSRPRKQLPRISPVSPGLLRPEDLEALHGSPDRANRWTERGDSYTSHERRRLAGKIATYAGYEGPPAKMVETAVRERPRGVNKSGWGDG